MLVKDCPNAISKMVFVILVSFIIIQSNAYSETITDDGQNLVRQVATDTRNMPSKARSMRRDVTPGIKGAAEKGLKTTSYTTNDFTEELQAQIGRFNEEFTNEPITQINDENLSQLIKYGLISRKKLDEYRKLTIINGKVYAKKTDAAATDIMLTNNKKGLFGELEQACQAIKEDKTRGESTGNVIPKKVIEMKPSELTFRDKNGERHTHENYYPVFNKTVSHVKINGKHYKTKKDFVTSVLMQKKAIQKGKLRRSGNPWFHNRHSLPLPPWLRNGHIPTPPQIPKLHHWW